MSADIYTLNNAGLFEPKFGSNMDKPKCAIKNLQLKVKNLNYIFTFQDWNEVNA